LLLALRRLWRLRWLVLRRRRRCCRPIRRGLIAIRLRLS
jgi:hypothetical protein